MTSQARALSTIAVAVLVVVGGLAGVGATPALAVEHTQATCEYPLVVEDGTGTEVELTEPAEEVVVLDAASAQVFWELGAANQVTGMPVAPFTEYLDGSEAKENVMTAEGTVIQEAVIELDPDIVVAANIIPDETIESLREAGLTVYQSPLEDSIDAITQKTSTYAQFIGACERADRVVSNVEADFETTEAATADQEAPLVLYYFDGFTAGQGSFINELLTAAGATTIADEEAIAGFQPISDEVIVDADPQWIVTPGMGVPEDEDPFASTTAVQEDQVLTVDNDLINQAAPRVVVPLRTATTAFYPEIELEPLNRLDPTVSIATPERVTPGEEFDVAVTVEQTGDYEGVDRVTVTVDGTLVHDEDTTLAAGETADITVTETAPDVDASTDMTVRVTSGAVTETTTVTVAPAADEDDTIADNTTPADDEPTDPIPGFGVPAAVLGLLVGFRLFATRS